MGKLEGKIALIAGGTGGVGEGITQAFLQEGATVVVASRKKENLEKLRESIADSSTERFVPIVGDIADTDSADNLRNQVLDKVGRLDAVVASLNGRWNEDIPLTKTSLNDWKRMLDSNLTGAFYCRTDVFTCVALAEYYCSTKFCARCFEKTSAVASDYLG